jgi:hypothetical protein
VASLIPAALFDLMTGGEWNPPTEQWGGVSNRAYPSPEAALDDLSTALIAWAISQPLHVSLTPVTADVTA